MLHERSRNLISAAVRHVADARHILSGSRKSPDQAWHLAGFGSECVRKALLEVDWLDKALGHDFDAATDSALELALVLSPLARRYSTPAREQVAGLEGWSPNDRYDRTGEWKDRDRDRDVERFVHECGEFVDELTFHLWLDGRIARKDTAP